MLNTLLSGSQILNSGWVKEGSVCCCMPEEEQSRTWKEECMTGFCVASERFKRFDRHILCVLLLYSRGGGNEWPQINNVVELQGNGKEGRRERELHFNTSDPDNSSFIHRRLSVFNHSTLILELPIPEWNGFNAPQNSIKFRRMSGWVSESLNSIIIWISQGEWTRYKLMGQQARQPGSQPEGVVEH